MALTTSTHRETTSARGWFDSTFRSTYDLKLKPQTFGQLVDRYGNGLSLTFAKNLAGQVKPVRNKTITIFEQGAPTQPIQVSISTAVAPVSNVTVTVNSGDGYLRQNFSIIIPKDYTDGTTNQEMRITGAAGARKGYFMNNSVAITSALSSAWVAVGASSFGYGSDSAEPMFSGAYSRTTTDRILKENIGIEGGVVANEEWEEFETKNGGKGVLTLSIMEMDFRLDDQLDSALITGQANSNGANITQASITGATKAVPSADGLDVIMASLGQELTWDATGFGIAKARALRPLLENVGVVNMALDLFAGGELISSMEENFVDTWLPTVAGGQTYWNEMGDLGFYIRSIQMDGVKMNVMKLNALSNPNKFGLSSYKYKYSGYLFTQGEYSATMVDGSEERLKLPHLTLGYLAGNGEDRQRIFVAEPGVHGISGVPGMVATSGYDGIKYHALTHIVPIWNHMYKTIKVNYNGSVGGGS